MTSRLSDQASLWGKRDPLSTVLLDLRLDGTFLCSSELGLPWSLDIPPRTCASFHFVVDGDCWLYVDKRRGSKPIQLTAGDLVLVPRSPRQVLSSSKSRKGDPIESLPAEQLSDVASIVRVAGDVGRWFLVCGGVRLEGLPALMLLNVLPEVMILRSEQVGPIVIAALDAMKQEALSTRPGSAALMTRLADVVVLLGIRSWIEASDQPSGWIAALRDPSIGRAMAELHHRPERSWSVDELARAASLSRSRFSQRFSDLVGVAPMQYVTRLQMHRARDLLRTNVSIGELATRFGYDSEPAFARAFKRHLGQPPGAMRRA